MMHHIEGKNMKREIVILLTAILVGFVALSSTRPVNANIRDHDWVKPALRGGTDQYLGPISVGYVTGTTWTLNVAMTNDATNTTLHHLDARISKIAVWFDWNKFYNTSLDVLIRYGDSRLFTVSGTTEDVAVASNMFTHNYTIYVDYKVSYISSSHVSVTEDRTWSTTTHGGFAVLSQDQFASRLAAQNFIRYHANLPATGPGVNDFAESMSLRLQAILENRTAESYYTRGEFSSALVSFNNAISLLNQSRSTYVSKHTVIEAGNLNRTLAEIDAIKANATATRTLSQATANAALVNSFAFILFGLGFIFFGIAAILFVRKGPKPS
jgi:hypothetical protein